MAIPPKLIFDPLAPIPARLGKADRARLAELREAYQTAIASRPAPAPLTRPDLVVEYMAPYVAGLEVEQAWVVPLDARCRPCCPPVPVSRGDVDGTDLGPRTVLRAALVAGATSVIVAHNHPTGDPSPSPADIGVTRRLVAAGAAVDVPLHDHLVLGAGGTHCSLRRDRPDLWQA